MILLKDIVHVPNEELRNLLLLFLTNENFEIIEKKVCELKCKGIIAQNSNILNDIKTLILNFTDRFWAPIIIEEYASLLNSSKKLSYRDFFLRKNLWQKKNGYIKNKYAYELCFLKKLLQKEKSNFLLFFNRLFEDCLEIRSIFAIKEPLEKLSGNLSDRHGFGSVLELNFTDGRKIIYKPRSAINDLFLTEYIKILKLDTIYNIHIPKAIDKQKYSWYEFIEHTVCKRKSELENFYRNSGAVLAVLDSLNYTDGHNENFICATPFWYLIDSETILTNLSYFSDKVDFFMDLNLLELFKN